MLIVVHYDDETVGEYTSLKDATDEITDRLEDDGVFPQSITRRDASGSILQYFTWECQVVLKPATE